MCCAIPLYRTHVKKRPMVISQKCRTMVSNKPLGDVVLLLDGILAPGLPRYSSTMWRRSESVKCFDMITGFLTSPIPYTSVRKNGGLAFGKTWLGNFFVLVREVKILRATTEKFSFVNLRKLEPHSGQFRNQIREESAYRHPFLRIVVKVILAKRLRPLP